MSVAEEAEADQIMADYNDDAHAEDDDGLEYNENEARNIATPQEISQIFGPFISIRCVLPTRRTRTAPRGSAAGNLCFLILPKRPRWI